MSSNSRIKNSFLNIGVAYLESIVGLLISFLNRIVFLHFLNAEYLGVSGLFSNILLIFSLVDLGIGSALTQIFYKPFAEKDYHHLSQVAHTTRVILNTVGVIVIALTCAFTPFLQLFVNDVNVVPHLRLIFFLHGISSGITYFLGYYRTIITANQQAYKLVKIDNGWKLLGFVGKTLVLAITKDFVCYLIIGIVLEFSNNIVVRSFVKKQIPEIDYKTKEFVSKEEQKRLFKNVAGLSMNKLANVVTNGTDNIIISKVLDLVAVGLSSNYVLIKQSVTGLVESVFSPLLASIGNICATENTETKIKHFNRLSFVSFWIYGFCSLTAFILSDRVIELVFGSEYLISRLAAFFICFDLFCVGTYRVSTLFRTAEGLFWYGKFRPLLQAVINLVASLILVNITGELWAVYAGTIVSRVVVTMWYEPLIVLKHAFKIKPWKYYSRLLSYVFVYFIALFSTMFAVDALPFGGIVGVLLGAILCVIIPNIIIMAAYFRTSEFAYWKDLTFNILRKVTKRTK